MDLGAPCQEWGSKTKYWQKRCCNCFDHLGYCKSFRCSLPGTWGRDQYTFFFNYLIPWALLCLLILGPRLEEQSLHGTYLENQPNLKISLILSAYMMNAIFTHISLAKVHHIVTPSEVRTWNLPMGGTVNHLTVDREEWPVTEKKIS